MLKKQTRTGYREFESRRRLFMLVMLCAFGWLQPLSANGLFENRPWQFTHKSRVKLLEIQELKDSGFYDANKSAASRAAGSTDAAGGTTINGLYRLEKRGVRSALIDAVSAAVARSKELGS